MPQDYFDVTRELSDYIIENIPFIGVNFWVAMYPTYFAKWSIEIDCSKAADAKQLIEFAAKVIHLGAQEKVYRLLNVEGLSFANKEEDIYYIRHLNRSVKKNKQLPFFDLSTDAKLYEGIYSTTMIGYHESWEWIKENYVHDLGTLSRHINGTVEDQYAAHVAPLTLKGSTLPLENDQILGDVARLDITLHTDIWFPWVVNFSHAQWFREVEPAANGLYDNRQLALRHTPRLNRFLEGVRRATDNIGGAWKLDQVSVHPQYRDQVSENGIHLEYPPDFTVTEAKPREKPASSNGSSA